MYGITFVLGCLLYSSNAVLDTTKYKEVLSCILPDEAFDSSIVNIRVKSILECATACAKHDECQAFRISTETCILHNRTLRSQTCSQYPVKEYKGYNDNNALCLNGGIYVSGSGCKCFDGYIGTNCETLMRDCQEGMDNGQYAAGEYLLLVHPEAAPDPFIILCKIEPWGGRTYLMYRKEGLVDFNRPWADYKAGFGNLTAEFWLGLDKIHYVTTSLPHQHRLVVEVTTRMPSDTYPYRQRYYVGFSVGDESTGYAFDFTSTWTHGDYRALGDCLTAMKGRKFTTSDVDNDDDPGNCASVHEGAWWFTGCGDCNPTGPFIRPTSGYLLNIPNEVFWYPGMPTYSIIHVELFCTRTVLQLTV